MSNRILSEFATYAVAVLCFLLMALYIVKFWGIPRGKAVMAKTTKSNLIIRGLNWGIFGLTFAFFVPLAGQFGIEASRATARVALVTLIITELAYQLGTGWYKAFWETYLKNRNF